MIGLLAAKNDIARARGIDKIVALTYLCFAIPLAVFGAEHLSSGKFMVNMVPSYMPWRLFWVYFVGFALIAASLSIATNGHPPALNEDFRVPITSDRTGNSRWVGVSGRGLAVLRRRCRLAADNHNGELCDKCGDCADGGEQWSDDNANGGYGHGNLHKRVAMLVLHNDALDVTLVDQLANLVNQVAAQHLNLFNEIIEAHIVDTLVAWGSSQKRLAIFGTSELYRADNHVRQTVSTAACRSDEAIKLPLLR